MNRPGQRLPSIRPPMFVAAALLNVACSSSAAIKPGAPSKATSQVENLHALARLYGVVRWFHPSDAAAVIDWDRFAIEGARRVIDAPNSLALRAALTELIAPFAPTVRLAFAGESFPDEPALHPPGSEGLEVVAWEHSGYGDSAVTSVYASKRRHRERTVAVAGVPYGEVWQSVDATPFRGARLRLRGKVRTRSPAQGRLWLRVERQGAKGFSDEMADRPVVSNTWKTAEIVGAVEVDATRILFGPAMNGTGSAWYDDLELAVQTKDGGWEPIEIADPGFEADDTLNHWKPGAGSASTGSLDGWKVTADHVSPASGQASLRIEADTRVLHDELFADAPQRGETVNIALGSGLRARIPISLYSKDGHTIGDDPFAAKRSQEGSPLPPSPGFDVVAGAADVIVAWNALQHFWPYWDGVSVDWIAELDTALNDALDDRTLDDHVETLQRLSAAVPDGHARVGCPGMEQRAKPPFAVEVIGDQIVVTATAHPEVSRGDVVVSLDGRLASAQLTYDEALASGSPQWRRVRARRQFGTGPRGSILTLRARRGDTEKTITVVRGHESLDEFARPIIERFADGIYYVDLARASTAAIDDAMARLSNAPGVVFDVRRGLASTRVLSNLLTRPDDAKQWLALPHIIRPDHGPSSISSWETGGWEMPAREPHISGRVAFLTGPGTASAAESFMSLVEHYRLGAIVGEPTAGANGNIAQVLTPTGCTSVFTGLRVTKPDGSRFHQIGVQPTIPASRTITGVAKGRDEVLEKALSYLRGGNK